MELLERFKEFGELAIKFSLPQSLRVWNFLGFLLWRHFYANYFQVDIFKHFFFFF